MTNNTAETRGKMAVEAALHQYARLMWPEPLAGRFLASLEQGVQRERASHIIPNVEEPADDIAVHWGTSLGAIIPPI
jgi:hypothetical protein